MRIAVVGLGGVGGYFGGKLALKYAGSGEHKIIFIARGAHLEAIRKNGLRVKTVEGPFTAYPTIATDKPSEAGMFDLVLFCVKSYGLEDAASAILGNLHASSVVIPTLNGVDITERLQGFFPEGVVLNGCVYISSHVAGPGLIEQTAGTCQLFFGPDRSLDAENFRYIERFFLEAGIKAELKKNAIVHVWTKYIFISPLAGMTALRRKPIGAIMADKDDREQVKGLMTEVENVARRKGVDLRPDIVGVSLERAASFAPGTKTSMQLDIENGRQTEKDALVGYIVRTGKEMGLQVPLYEKLNKELGGN